MAKVTKRFSFEIPVTKSFVDSAKIDQRHIGSIEVAGKVELSFNVNDEPEITYESVKWNKADILPLLDNMSAFDDAMQFIFDATMHHVLTTFSRESLSQK